MSSQETREQIAKALDEAARDLQLYAGRLRQGRVAFDAIDETDGALHALHTAQRTVVRTALAWCAEEQTMAELRLVSGSADQRAGLRVAAM